MCMVGASPPPPRLYEENLQQCTYQLSFLWSLRVYVCLIASKESRREEWILIYIYIYIYIYILLRFFSKMCHYTPVLGNGIA